MKIEFEQGTITIQAGASDWGPFNFNFEDALPSGYSLVSCTVKSYLGRVKPGDNVANFTETTSELINTTAVASNTTCTVTFDKPTTAAYIDVSHSLVFSFSITGGGTHTAYYYRVKVI
jgi:hypothetical protein